MSTKTNTNIIKEIARLMSNIFGSEEENKGYEEVEELQKKVEADIEKRLGAEATAPINSGAKNRKENNSSLINDKYSKLLEMSNTLKGKNKKIVSKEELGKGKEIGD